MDQGPHRVGPLEELRRRRVMRVATAYAAVVFAVLELAHLVLTRMAAPYLAWRVVLGVAVLGFPVAIVLSFIYDITPTGIVRTPEDATENPEYDVGPVAAWAAVVLLALAAGLVIRSFGA